MSHDLLWRHVAGRADRETDRGQVGRLAGASRQPEVCEQGAAVSMYQHIRGLEVAMDDPGVVGVLKPVTDLAQVAPRAEGVEWSAFQDVTEGSAADQRHRQVRHAVGQLEVIDGEDVGMVELGQRLGLRLETLDEALVLQQLR